MQSGGFTKLVADIVTSSIWCEDKDTKILWITILALADKDGVCHASLPGLAKTAQLTIPETVAALKKLESPDLYSRTKTDEGRRLRRIDAGWFVINHGYYRDLARKEDRKEYIAQKVREHRAAEKEPVNTCKQNVNNASVYASVSSSASASLTEDNTEMIKKWNEIATRMKFRTVQQLTLSRKRHIAARLKENKDPLVWQQFWNTLLKSTHLSDASWFSFDWCFKSSENFDKVRNDWTAWRREAKKDTPKNHLVGHRGSKVQQQLDEAVNAWEM